MEPNAAVAEYDAIRQRLTVWPSTQVPFYGHLIYARCTGLEKGQIRVIKPFVGGGFGARTETLHHEVVCALVGAVERVGLANKRFEGSGYVFYGSLDGGQSQ